MRRKIKCPVYDKIRNLKVLSNKRDNFKDIWKFRKKNNSMEWIYLKNLLIKICIIHEKIAIFNGSSKEIKFGKWKFDIC